MIMLTDRQTNILMTAFEQGYYDIPRRVKTEELAVQFHITRYGLERALRTAENKLVNSVMPFLYSKNMLLEPQESKSKS